MDIRLPRKLVVEGKEDCIIKYLSARPAIPIGTGEVSLALIEADECFLTVLSREVLRRRAVYGLEAIREKLLQEEKGLKEKSDRVSRLLITSRDGSSRFYRQVANLIEHFAPRLMGLMVDVDASTLGTICGRKEGRPVKAILVTRKEGVADVLSSLVVLNSKKEVIP
ncbi:MAG: hypothetical protein N2572_05400 [Syntrophales bacterium]|nr:hypothetical protein [Syntrophales bacterium]